MKNLKDLYIDFFLSKEHKKLDSASVVPENDPTCLFNTAGMQPLVPYLLGQPHPLGTRLCNFQKCFRLTDLESVGDKTHHTFFEMLGNWSLGDYFKKESISWSFEFLTSVLEIPLERLAFTVFEGNDVVERDDESAEIWMNLGVPKDRISYLPAEDNWWPAIEQLGPCGPDTEIFYWSDNDNAPPVEHDASDKRWVEIWNNVFMQYSHEQDGTFKPLAKRNVDTGMGVERTTLVLQGVDDSYKTYIWQPIISKIEEISGKLYADEENIRPIRIIADHMRAITVISADEAKIVPSNTDQGYILRRLIRRMYRYASKLGIDIKSDFTNGIVDVIVDQFGKYYPELVKNKQQVIDVLSSEKVKFAITLEKGLKEFEKVISHIEGDVLPAGVSFKLYDTFGFPIEFTTELANERGKSVSIEAFNEKFKEHQEKSRQGSENKFKGGLADDGEITARLHTATHLLQAALRKTLGSQVGQKGSNITPERLRFDFNFERKMTPEEIKAVEDFVNEAIAANVNIICEEMPLQSAFDSGATGLFEAKYSDVVNVYTIGEFSKEICGGPHAKNTSELGTFKVKKEEASSAGVRRIKAVLL